LAYCGQGIGEGGVMGELTNREFYAFLAILGIVLGTVYFVFWVLP